MSLTCAICINPAAPRLKYCSRCYKLINVTHRNYAARRKALSNAYDKDIDAFRCFFTGAPLDEKDPMSPWFTSICPRVPGKNDDMVVASALAVMMKTDLSADELLTVIPELDDHLRTGKAFNRNIILFSYWKRCVPPALRGRPANIRCRAAIACTVCGKKPFPNSPYCPRCRKFITKGCDNATRLEALKVAWNAEQDGFLCHYTGMRLEENNVNDPWYLVFDHLVPGQKKLAAAGFWVNDMKGVLSDAGFGKAVAEFARHIRTGEPFD